MNSKNECECCICMDNINDTNYTLTQCGHVFHSSCIIKNLFNNGFSCPMCRFKFEENNKKNLLNEKYYLTYKISISHICMFYFIIYLIFMNVLVFKLIYQNKITI